MSQVEKMINLNVALDIYDKVIEKIDYPNCWDKSYLEVRHEIVNAASNSIISYHKISAILEEAKTSKMHGLANRGIENIKQQLRKSYLNKEE